MFTHASFPTYSTTAEINNSRDKTTTEKVDSFPGPVKRCASDQRLKAVKFPNYKTLETFNFKSQPSINKMLVTELTYGEYIDRKENVLPFCNSRTGKTHLATAMGIATCAQGKRIRFFRVTEIITQLMETQEERELLRFRKQLSKIDLLVLDTCRPARSAWNCCSMSSASPTSATA